MRTTKVSLSFVTVECVSHAGENHFCCVAAAMKNKRTRQTKDALEGAHAWVDLCEERDVLQHAECGVSNGLVRRSAHVSCDLAHHRHARVCLVDLCDKPPLNRLCRRCCRRCCCFCCCCCCCHPPRSCECALFFFSSFSGTHRRKRFVRSANTNTNTNATRKRPVLIGLLCVRRWCIPHHCFFFALRLWCDSGAAASGMTISYLVRPLFASRLLPPSLPLLLCRLQPMRMRWLHTRSA